MIGAEKQKIMVELASSDGKGSLGSRSCWTREANQVAVA